MDQDFLDELIEIFKSEADDYIQVLNRDMAALQQEASAQVLEEIFRTTHSLKGAARAVNFSGIEELCQVLESIFSKLKQNEMELNPELLDLLQESIDHLSTLIEEGSPDATPDATLLERLNGVLSGEAPPAKPPAAPKPEAEAKPVPPPKPPVKKIKELAPKPAPPKPSPQPTSSGPETIRVPYKRIDALFNQSEELLTVKIKTRHYAQEIGQLLDLVETLKAKLFKEFSNLGDWLRQHNVKDGAKGHEQCQIMQQHLQPLTDTVQDVAKRLSTLKGLMENDAFQIASLIDNHLTDIRQLMMFPFSSITNHLQKSTRTIARELNKKIELTIIGKEIELDKHALEMLKDPLIHIIRNSIDHGIESPEERKSKGKPEVGHVSIEVLPPRDQRVIIKIHDDGRGLDLERIKQKALEKQLVSEEELAEMNEAQILGLIFKSGFSTKEGVTRLSGRGLGMAVVAENIEKLGGTIKIENHAPHGSTFLLSIPLSIASSRGILISVGPHRFIIPTKFVEVPLRLSISALKTVGAQPVIPFEGKNVPVFNLAELLDIESAKTSSDDRLNVLILKQNEQYLAVYVDRIQDEREIILKNLNPPLQEVSLLAGLTILGDGTLVPVLNVGDLFESATKAKKMASADLETTTRRILVAEDSITSRVLLKNILETAGFKVKTAVNGRQAWEMLQKEKFDLLISDVEMPEMDGFELTRRVRGHEPLSELPVILLTSLKSEEDQEKGLQAGANAYFIKSRFEQNSLLDIINKLI